MMQLTWPLPLAPLGRAGSASAWSFFAAAMGSWTLFSPPSYGYYTGWLGLMMYAIASGEFSPLPLPLPHASACSPAEADLPLHHRWKPLRGLSRETSPGCAAGNCVPEIFCSLPWSVRYDIHIHL